MKNHESRLLLSTMLPLAALLMLSGVLLRGWVASTLTAENEVNLAFLDLALRDRSRYLGETLSNQWKEAHGWPQGLNDILTRNHADYNRDIFIQVFTPDGRAVASSSNTPESVGLTPRKVEENGGPTWNSSGANTTTGRPVRLVTYPVYTGHGMPEGFQIHGYSQAGLLMPDTKGALTRFTLGMAGIMAGMGGIFGIALRTAVSSAAQRWATEFQTLQAAQHRFIGDAAHELGTPLAVLRGEIDIALRRERPAGDYRAALTSCREEIERLSRLSENLLALAAADARQPMIHQIDCDAVTIARGVHHRFERMALEKGVILVLESPDTLPWHADTLAIEQILGNLIANAVRHTPEGETVTLTLSRCGDTLIYEVADTGEGIPPAHLPALFDRFHRVDKSRSRQAGGAGLGLAIVKTLVEAHGGSITVQSSIGHGSAFTCRFAMCTAAGQFESTSGQNPA